MDFIQKGISEARNSMYEFSQTNIGLHHKGNSNIRGRPKVTNIVEELRGYKEK